MISKNLCLFHFCIQVNFNQENIFDEESLKELVNSIKKSGIIQPIVVRKDTNEGGYEIIAMERRWRASKITKSNSVPVL